MLLVSGNVSTEIFNVLPKSFDADWTRFNALSGKLLRLFGITHAYLAKASVEEAKLTVRQSHSLYWNKSDWDIAAKVADNANVALYATFAPVGFFAGSVVNRLGKLDRRSLSKICTVAERSRH